MDQRASLNRTAEPNSDLRDADAIERDCTRELKAAARVEFERELEFEVAFEKVGRTINVKHVIEKATEVVVLSAQLYRELAISALSLLHPRHPSETESSKNPQFRRLGVVGPFAPALRCARDPFPRAVTVLPASSMPPDVWRASRAHAPSPTFGPPASRRIIMPRRDVEKLTRPQPEDVRPKSRRDLDRLEHASGR